MTIIQEQVRTMKLDTDRINDSPHKECKLLSSCKIILPLLLPFCCLSYQKIFFHFFFISNPKLIKLLWNTKKGIACLTECTNLRTMLRDILDPKHEILKHMEYIMGVSIKGICFSLLTLFSFFYFLLTFYFMIFSKKIF